MAKHKITIESENIEELVRKLMHEFKKFELGPVAKSAAKIIRKTTCQVCDLDASEIRGISSKTGKPYHGIFCITEKPDHTKWLED